MITIDDIKTALGRSGPAPWEASDRELLRLDTTPPLAAAELAQARAWYAAGEITPPSRTIDGGVLLDRMMQRMPDRILAIEAAVAAAIDGGDPVLPYWWRKATRASSIDPDSAEGIAARDLAVSRGLLTVEQWDILFAP